MNMPIVELTDFDNPNCVNEFFSLYTHIPYYQTIQPSPGVHVQLTFLKHNTPFSEGRQFQGLLSRDGKRVVARAVAVHDQRYNQQWGERLGHLIMFEALPSSWEASRQLVDKACEWLRKQGLNALPRALGRSNMVLSSNLISRQIICVHNTLRRIITL